MASLLTGNEKVLEILRSAAEAAVLCFPEAEGVAVVVSWKGQLRELPVGLVRFHPEVPLTAARLSRLSEQLTRMNGVVLGQLEQLLGRSNAGGPEHGEEDQLVQDGPPGPGPPGHPGP
jgi:hypothetical protein